MYINKTLMNTSLYKYISIYNISINRINIRTINIILYKLK